MHGRVWRRAAAVLAVGAVAAGIPTDGASAGGQPSGVASPATAEPRGRDAWWFEQFKLAEAHQKVTGKGVTIALIDTPIDPTVPELKGQKVLAVTNVCGGPKTARGPLADHGSGMASLIVGSGRGTLPGGRGTAGVAPGATLRSYATDNLPDEGIQCTPADGTPDGQAFDLAISDGARIILYAAGTGRPVPAVSDAVARALRTGVIVVVSAGDDRDP